MSKYFKLYQSINIVEGYKRALIVDFQHRKSLLIPLSLFHVLKLCETNSISSIMRLYSKDEEKKIILDYFKWLFDYDLGFFCQSKKEMDTYPKMDVEFNYPFKISNIIIELDENFSENVIMIVNGIKLNIQNFELRFYSAISYGIICKYLELFENSLVEQINLVLPFESVKTDKFEKLAFKYLRVKLIFVYNSSYDEQRELLNGQTFLVFVKRSVSSNIFCGKISKDYFTVNHLMYSESQHHNTCLNRKISIDKDGYIRNCPSMPQHFGNIKDTTLEEALNHPDFKKYWNVTKDMIAVCKDCEFRHICTDCRAYTERTHFEEDIDLSKPLKCGYNPYTNEWAEWSTNSLKQKAIEYYGMQELVKKKD